MIEDEQAQGADAMSEPASSERESSGLSPDGFWDEVRPRREPMQKRWFLPAVLVLLVISVPWYWPTGSVSLLGGLPVFAWITLGCSAVIAALTAFVAMRAWDDSGPGGGGE